MNWRDAWVRSLFLARELECSSWIEFAARRAKRAGAQAEVRDDGERWYELTVDGRPYDFWERPWEQPWHAPSAPFYARIALEAFGLDDPTVAAEPAEPPVWTRYGWSP